MVVVGQRRRGGQEEVRECTQRLEMCCKGGEECLVSKESNGGGEKEEWFW